MTKDDSMLQADAQGRSTFVVTSDAYRFYEAVGYKLVGERWLGVDNPRWKGEPVPVRVVSIVITLLVKDTHKLILFDPCSWQGNHTLLEHRLVDTVNSYDAILRNPQVTSNDDRSTEELNPLEPYRAK